MSVDPIPEHSDARNTEIQLTLTGPEAERLRITLPWLLRALEDRPTVQPRHRERRHQAHTALEHLLGAVSTQLGQAGTQDRTRPTGAVIA